MNNAIESTDKPSILVVDDTRENLRLLAGILTDQGYTTRLTPDGTLALESVQASRPDLILLDIMMPGMDGYEVCRRLKADEQTRNIPVIFISALHEVFDKVKAFQVGGVDYISKPFQVEEVLARVQTHLMLQMAQRKLRDQNMQLQQEIEERKRVEEELRKYHRAVEQSSASIIITDIHGDIEYVNPKFVQISGYAADEVIGHNPRFLKSGFMDQYQYNELWEIISSGREWRGEFHNRRRDGTLYWEIASISPIFNEAGHITHFVSVKEDITDQKHMQQMLADERAMLAERVRERTSALSTANAELTRASRLKDEFLASISHELRTPLNAILGMSEALHSHVYGDMNEKQLETIEIITQSGQRLLKLVNDVLDLARIDAGKVKINKTPCMVRSVAQATLQVIAKEARHKHLETSFEIDESIQLAFLDESCLRQVLVKLLDNAVKFTPEHGKIGVKIFTDDASSAIYFQVWDSGIGMSLDDLEHLFQPFVQLDGGTARHYAGTGLGLAIAYRLIDKHCGSISVESTLDAGSCFTIALPWHEMTEEDIATWQGSVSSHDADSQIQQPLEQSVPSEKYADVEHAHTIVLADDNEMFIETLASFLTEKGYRVVVARNAVEVIDRVREERPSMLLLDFEMPGMDGMKLLQTLKEDETLQNMPVAILASLVRPNDKERYLEAGASIYVARPFRHEWLLETIESCCANTT